MNAIPSPLGIKYLYTNWHAVKNYNQLFMKALENVANVAKSTGTNLLGFKKLNLFYFYRHINL